MDASTAARRLARQIKAHVDANRGITNVFVEAVCRQACPLVARWRGRRRGKKRCPEVGKKKKKIFFRGVFCSNRLPRSLLSPSSPPFSIIVNLAPSPSSPPPPPPPPRKSAATKRNGSRETHKRRRILEALTALERESGHFVFISSTEGGVTYFDPFGIKCFQPDVRSFLDAIASTKKGDKRRKKVKQNTQRIQSPFSQACGLYAILFALATEADISPFLFTWNKNRLRLNDILCMNYLSQLLSLEE